jgi:curli biogenesis system outer membrane secretion channel CsgG
MNRFTGVTVALSLILLAGCGAEVATTAATGAAIKAREVEEGKKTMERAKQKIDAATQQMQQSAQRAADADK